MEKRDYWKVVSSEWSEGVICHSLDEARDFAEAERDCGDTAYIRRVRMTEEEFEKVPEL